MKFIDVLKYRPLTVLGLLSALQSIMYGIGYVIKTDGFTQTVLFDAIMTLVDPQIAGAIILVTGLGMVASMFCFKEKFMKGVFQFDAVLWLFAFIIYCMAGAPILGFAITGIFSLMSGYIGFAYPRRRDVAMYNALE